MIPDIFTQRGVLGGDPRPCPTPAGLLLESGAVGGSAKRISAVVVSLKMITSGSSLLYTMSMSIHSVSNKAERILS